MPVRGDQVRYTIDLSPEVYRALEALAEREESSLAYQVRRAIRMYLIGQNMLEGTPGKSGAGVTSNSNVTPD